MQRILLEVGRKPVKKIKALIFMRKNTAKGANFYFHCAHKGQKTFIPFRLKFLYYRHVFFNNSEKDSILVTCVPNLRVNRWKQQIFLNCPSTSQDCLEQHNFFFQCAMNKKLQSYKAFGILHVFKKIQKFKDKINIIKGLQNPKNTPPRIIRQLKILKQHFD